MDAPGFEDWAGTLRRNQEWMEQQDRLGLSTNTTQSFAPQSVQAWAPNWQQGGGDVGGLNFGAPGVPAGNRAGPVFQRAPLKPSGNALSNIGSWQGSGMAQNYSAWPTMGGGMGALAGGGNALSAGAGAGGSMYQGGSQLADQYLRRY